MRRWECRGVGAIGFRLVATAAQLVRTVPDGDFILRVENHSFKVHHARLQTSEIFTDMPALPQPPNTDYIDGCPFVELTDSATDWLVALKWMYDPE